MMERMVVVFVLFVIFLARDIVTIKRMRKCEKMVYVVSIIVAVYLGTAYITDLDWPFLQDIAYWLFREPARVIVDLLKVSK
ncbi:hypothetical protein [Paenibacillus arenilitoris]|uniref:Uncharacterized protein n=1 Tax=Paenibacillus arenilitoris TaxID=2772299 RepID=A0A927CU18_9BACL|nr:hypothetical protein [Paenibacillus arenilitoris]MBD2872933.1 hypothetical protein [Paenibacillus arenilitoris]